MPEATFTLRTLVPIHIPLTVSPGLNRRSPGYREYLQGLLERRKNLVNPDRVKRQEYESIDSDSWNNRVFIWQDKAQFPGVRVHVFPNNIAIAEVELELPYSGQANAAHHEMIEREAQHRSKAILAEAYSHLVYSLEQFTADDKRGLFSLDHRWLTDLKIFWVSRAWLIRSEQLEEQGVQALLKSWLAHTYQPQDAEDIIAGDKDYSLTWLNYVLVDFDEPILAAPESSSRELDQGLSEKNPVGKLDTEEDPRLDAMLLAQYYYSAQEYCNQGLSESIDRAYSDSKMADVQQQLSQSRVISRLHQVDYYEHLNYLTRPKRALLEEILACWNYDSLKDNGHRMIDICSSRIEEVESKKRERSSLMTDLLLVALSFFAVFELSLYLMELSREMVSRPALSYTDADSSFFLEIIAKIDTDIMFGTGFALTVLLVVVYNYMKSR